MTEPVILGNGYQDALDLVIRRSKQPNTEQRDDYLALLWEGIPHVLAARMVGATGTSFRGLRHREDDFREKCEAAEQQGRSEFAESVRAELTRIAMGHVYDDTKSEHPKHYEALVKLAEAVLPEMEHKRRRHVTHDGEVSHRLIPEWIDQAKLDALPQEERQQLIELAGKIAADRPPQRALGS